MEQQEKVNILLVDDTPANLLSIKSILDELDQNIFCASSGQEALKHLLHEDFAAILIDVNMPGMSGFELAKLIRLSPRYKHTPIIFITAIRSSEIEQNTGYLLGAVDYIFSPVVPEILRAKVAVFIDLFKMTKAFKEQAEELSIANEKLKELDKLKSIFVSVASHELKTPITSIMGFSELLLDDNNMDIELRMEYLHIIYTEAERLTNILNDLLDLSKIDSGKQIITTKVINIREIIEDALLRFKNEAMKKGLSMINIVPEEISVMANRDATLQILINFLSNAIKYSYSGKDVVVSSEISGREVIINIIDHGMGMSEAELSHIFIERFYRSERPEIRNICGTGLGLSIVKNLAGLQGRRCWATSELDKGSKFSFTIPLGEKG